MMRASHLTRRLKLKLRRGILSWPLGGWRFVRRRDKGWVIQMMCSNINCSRLIFYLTAQKHFKSSIGDALWLLVSCFTLICDCYLHLAEKLHEGWVWRTWNWTLPDTWNDLNGQCNVSGAAESNEGIQDTQENPNCRPSRADCPEQEECNSAKGEQTPEATRRLAH